MNARRQSTFADILRTVGALGAILLVLALVGKVFTITPDHAGTSVDPKLAATGEAQRAKELIWYPRRLPSGWRANAAEMRDGDVWHVGVVTDKDDYIGLEQTKTSVAETLRDFSPRSRREASQRIAGHLWTRRAETDGDTVYVRRSGRSTLLVIGGAPRSQIERYVSSLVSAS